MIIAEPNQQEAPIPGTLPLWRFHIDRLNILRQKRDRSLALREWRSDFAGSCLGIHRYFFQFLQLAAEFNVNRGSLFNCAAIRFLYSNWQMTDQRSGNGRLWSASTDSGFCLRNLSERSRSCLARSSSPRRKRI